MINDTEQTPCTPTKLACSKNEHKWEQGGEYWTDGFEPTFAHLRREVVPTPDSNRVYPDEELENICIYKYTLHLYF